MLSSVSSGLPPMPLAPSGDAMAGGRAEPAGHGGLQKGRRPQLIPPSLNLQPEKHLWLGSRETEAGAALCPPLAGEACTVPWYPTGILHAFQELPKRDLPPCVCLSLQAAAFNLARIRPWAGAGTAPSRSQELDGYWGGRGKVWGAWLWDGVQFADTCWGGGTWGGGERRWPGWSRRLCEPFSSSSSLPPARAQSPRGN